MKFLVLSLAEQYFETVLEWVYQVVRTYPDLLLVYFELHYFCVYSLSYSRLGHIFFLSYLVYFILKYHINLKSNIPSISFELKLIVSKVLFVTSNTAILCTNLSFTMSVLCSFLSSILPIARPEISSINGASIFMNYVLLASVQPVLLERKV